MILSDFRYQDPWSEENFTLPNFIQQSQAQQRHEQQVEINRQTLDKLLTKLSLKDIVGLDHAKRYLRHKYRQNCKANTLKNDFTTITLFLSYLKSCGKSQVDQIGREDLEAFVEHEQDRGLKIVSVSNRLGSLYAFLRYLIDHDLADARLLTRKIKLKVADALPRAMDAEDVKCLLAVLDDVRNRAMILLLLRTGMRIGELLNTKLVDVYLADKKIMIYEGEKNRRGRSVCISDDACQALQAWLDNLKEGLAVIRRTFSLNQLREFTKTKKIRIIPLHPETIKELKKLPIPINKEQFVFTKKGKPYSESWARKIWNKAKSELEIEDLKLYEGTRHSVASQAYNRGVPLELIGEMLGHTNPKTTKRYSHVDPSRLISVILNDNDTSKLASGTVSRAKISKLFGD